MNLIEAWKINPKCSVTRQSRRIDFNTFQDFNTLIHSLYIYESDWLSDDWEIVKTPRKVVIEGIKFYNSTNHPYICNLTGGQGKQLDKVHLKLVNMTLEWEE